MLISRSNPKDPEASSCHNLHNPKPSIPRSRRKKSPQQWRKASDAGIYEAHMTHNIRISSHMLNTRETDQSQYAVIFHHRHSSTRVSQDAGPKNLQTNVSPSRVPLSALSRPKLSREKERAIINGSQTTMGAYGGTSLNLSIIAHARSFSSSREVATRGSRIGT